MAYFLAYSVPTGSSITHFQHEFATEAARNRFRTSTVPSNAFEVVMWPRPKFTKTQRTLWWDLNKRPFADRYVLQNES